jgi:hypothetical protein
MLFARTVSCLRQLVVRKLLKEWKAVEASLFASVFGVLPNSPPQRGGERTGRSDMSNHFGLPTDHLVCGAREAQAIARSIN